MAEAALIARRRHCEFETMFAPGSGFLDGTINVTVSEIGIPSTPSVSKEREVVFNPEQLEVCVEWELTGVLARLICGKWCVCVDFDCVGEGPNFDFDRCRTIDFDCTADGKFKECFPIRVTDIPKRDDRCTIVCRIIVTVALLDCLERPARVAGYCEGGLVQFSPAS